MTNTITDYAKAIAAAVKKENEVQAELKVLRKAKAEADSIEAAAQAEVASIEAEAQALVRKELVEKRVAEILAAAK